MQKQVYTTQSVEETIALGGALGQRLRGGEVFECRSDLGGGKTTLASGIAQGAGSQDPVASPSFTLCNTYQTDSGRQIFHFDFYRLNEPGIMKNELVEVVDDPKAIVLIEWADIVESVLPESHCTIQIESTSETERQITLSVPTELSYVLPSPDEVVSS